MGAALTVALGWEGSAFPFNIADYVSSGDFWWRSIDSLVMSGEFGGGLIWLFATSMLALAAPIAI